MFLSEDSSDWLFLPETDSTNRYLLAGDFPSGTSCLADFQSQGRGRKGRSWVQRPGDGFLYSGLLSGPRGLLFQRPAFIPLLAGLSVRDALLDYAASVAGKNPAFFELFRELPGRLAVKWPNDVLLADSKGKWGKLAGVLIESRESDGRLDLVIGIGLNWKGEPPKIEQTDKAEKRPSFPPVSLFANASDACLPREFLSFLLPCLNERLRLYYEKKYSKIAEDLRKVFFLQNRMYAFQGRSYAVSGLSDQGQLLLKDESGHIFGITEAE